MANQIKALIVDDESLARQGLQLRLKAFADVDVLELCCNGREALDAVAKHEPDLLFLDVQMPGQDGFDVVRSIQGDNMPIVVFVTAFDQYAVEAFDVHAIDYLLKPIDEERLKQTLEKVRSHIRQRGALNDKAKLLNMIGDITGNVPGDINALTEAFTNQTNYPDKLLIKDGSTTTKIEVKDIGWIDAAGDYMCVHVAGEIHIMRSTMKQLETQLNPEIFQRIHRSTIVNLNKVSQVCSHINGEYHLVLECGAKVKMSRTFKDKIKHFL